MFKIGEFSRFSQVTVKTLRYYDEIGLLKPAEVDPFTGYRYYSANQFPRIHCILALKDLGLTLEQIGDLLEGDLTPDQIRGILRVRQSEIKQQVAEEQARLARVEQRLRQIEQEEEPRRRHRLPRLRRQDRRPGARLAGERRQHHVSHRGGDMGGQHRALAGALRAGTARCGWDGQARLCP
jgi:DNA-binding transcriptional MerR regulator